MIANTPKQSSYAYLFERKMGEVFDHLDVDPKRALKTIQKEIDARGKKIAPSEMLQLRVVKALVLERNNRVTEARDEIFSIFNEIE